MVRWVPYAFVRITIFFIAGILIGIYTDHLITRIEALQLVVVLAATYALFWIFIRKSAFQRSNVLFALIGFLAFAALGYFNLLLSNQSLDENHIINASQINAYEGTVSEPAVETAKTNRYLINVSAILTNSTWEEASGKVYVYINKNDSCQFFYGDQLLINGHPDLLNPPGNPGEFDYKRFLSFQHVYHSDFVVKNQLALIGHSEGNYFIVKALQIRQWATETLSNAIINPRERNIALALILGVKEGLDDDIKEAYSASGAMHVLAVSGLHVGIIYGIIVLLLSKLNNSKSGRWLFAIVALLCLWTYAAVTGFSPSVLRAVTMFSFIALSKASGRNTNIYNTLAASAFALLIFNPYLIMSVGFQLSFLAVLGIVYIQPKVYSIFITENYVIDKIWAITSVAIAAQLATFPLGLLYFHQFPTFFFLSNLVVIPGAFLILIGGLGILSVSFIPVLASFLGKVVEGIIYVINELVFLIKEIPHSQLNDIYITTFQSWLIIGGILTFFLLFQHRQIKYLYASLSLVLIFSVIQWNRVIQNQQLEKITFYKVNGSTAIDFISSGHSVLYLDKKLQDDENKRRFHIKPNHLRSGITSTSYHTKLKSTDSGLKIIDWHGKSILIYDNKVNSTMKLKRKLAIDYLVIGASFNGKLAWLLDRFEFDTIILDGSLSKFRADLLRDQALSLKLKCYSVYHEGAYEVFI